MAEPSQRRTRVQDGAGTEVEGIQTSTMVWYGVKWNEKIAEQDSGSVGKTR